MKDRLAQGTHRINGRLHSIHHVHDDDGKAIATVAKRLKVEFHSEDVAQLIAGALVMALPVAMTEEVWDLGGELSTLRILLVAAVSLFTLAMFIWGLFYSDGVGEYRGHFLKRVAAAYLLTFLVALVLLILFDKAPIEDLRLTAARTVLVAFPAAFAATAVDYMK